MPNYLEIILKRRNSAVILGILILSSVVGLVANALRSDSIVFIRKPLRETRATVKIINVMSQGKKTINLENKTPKQILKPDEKNIETITSNSSISNPDKPEKKTSISANQALFTTLKDSKSSFDSKKALFVDARPKIDYDAGHIPGAVSLYLEDLDKLYETVLSNIPKDRILITYCSDPECLSATELADKLVSRGHLNVYIMIDGIPGWKDSGYPIIESKENGNIEKK